MCEYINVNLVYIHDIIYGVIMDLCKIHIFASAYIYIYSDLIRGFQIASLLEKPGGFLFFSFCGLDMAEPVMNSHWWYLDLNPEATSICPGYYSNLGLSN